MKSYLSEFTHDVDLMHQTFSIPVKKIPANVKKHLNKIKDIIPVVNLTHGFLHALDASPVSYVLTDRQAFYKALPLITINQINKQAYGEKIKLPDELIVLNYEQWTGKIIKPAIMILAQISNDLVFCLNWFRDDSDKDAVKWAPASDAMQISFGYTFNKRPDKKHLAKKIYDDPHALDDWKEHILITDLYDPASLTEVFTLLGSFILALKDKSTKIQKVVEGNTSYKVLVYKGHVC
jgi:hypothetical protein